jgi:TolB-like protein
MTPERWQRIEALCTQALPLDQAARDAFLAAACGDDTALRADIESLLRHHSSAEGFLQSPLAGAAAIIAASGLPARIGSYRILSRLGSGGMGEVFLAEDSRLRRQVAIKRALPTAMASADAGSRLLTEARAAAQLDHPCVCPIFEVGEDDGLPFIVMPVVEGETLQARLRARPLSIEESLDVAAGIADALAAAHARGILHRDIKPANLMLNARGEVRVMDFGLARFTVEPRSSDADTFAGLTAVGATVGTAAYMSPEQARGDRVDARTDIFSLGVVLYEMVAGRRPFDGGSFAEIVAATLHKEPVPLSEQRPFVPAELQRIVSKALQKSPDGRYPSANDLLVDLRALLASLRSGAHVDAPVPAPARRGRALFAAALLLLAAVTSAAWWKLSQPSGFGETVDSLIVLPIVNDTGDAEKEYVADALTDSLIRDLSLLPRLKIIGRQTAFQYKGKSVTPQEVGRALPVRAVMSGRLRRAGDQLAIDVELSDARDGSVIISRHYLQPIAQAARIEVDITSDVVRDLRVRLAEPDARRLARVSTTNGNAYQLHLRARFYDNLGTPAGFHEALRLNKLAIAEDPNYAVAWLDASEEEFHIGAYFEAAREWMPEAKVAALQALRIDPDMAGAHVMLGMVALIYDFDLPTAERELAPVGELEPGAINVFTCAVHLLGTMKKPGEADRVLQQALALDPFGGPVRAEVGCNAYYRRQYAAAVAGDLAALEIDPRDMIALWGLGRAYAQLNKYDDALAALAKIDLAPPIIVAERAYVLARAGRRAEALRTLDQLLAMKAHVYVDPYFVAEVRMGLGDTPGAIASLKSAYDSRSGLIAAISTEPKWDAIRGTPAFAELQKRVGF